MTAEMPQSRKQGAIKMTCVNLPNMLRRGVGVRAIIIRRSFTVSKMLMMSHDPRQMLEHRWLPQEVVDTMYRYTEQKFWHTVSPRVIMSWGIHRRQASASYQICSAGNAYKGLVST